MCGSRLLIVFCFNLGYCGVYLNVNDMLRNFDNDSEDYFGKRKLFGKNIFWFLI